VRWAQLALLTVIGLGLAGCDGHGAAAPSASPPPALTASPTRSPPALPSATVSSSVPAFVGTATPATAADLPHSWRPGCPVGPDQLSVLRLGYWGFDDRPHVGTMVVHRSVTDDVVKIFGILYRERFPIRRMQPVDAYGGSDDASMADDNTSAFNCRYAVAPGTPHWSAHAYGQAVDVNTVENPYVLGTRVLPPAGAAYLDRSVYRPGMAVPGGALVRAFAAAGWKWGGQWSTPDYQHFSRNGR
jgi:hypothetical protein